MIGQKIILMEMKVCAQSFTKLLMYMVPFDPDKESKRHYLKKSLLQ